MRWNRLAPLGGTVIALAAGWMLLVDASWFIEDCPHCGFSSGKYQYRVATIPVRTFEHPSESLLQRVAADLGVPCEHADLHSRQKQRWWGLVWCVCPCHNGIDHISGDDPAWYSDCRASEVQRRAAADPEFAEVFRQKVLVENDYVMWKQLVADLDQCCHGE